MPELLLYTKAACPFCRKVVRFVESRDRKVPMRDIAVESGAREDLIAVGGKAQVPCLVVDGSAMYESDDIIAYLDGLFS